MFYLPAELIYLIYVLRGKLKRAAEDEQEDDPMKAIERQYDTLIKC